jgi:hypothetical protein
MLEHGASLATWALPQAPDTAAEMTAPRLPDHRLAYLDYEGPVSGGRGTVSRWDQGTYRTEHQTDDQWIVTLQGQRLPGRVVLDRLPGEENSWRFALVAPPTS